MGYYSSQIITNRGLEAITRAEAGEVTLTFTSLRTGAGTYTQQEVSKLDDAVSLKNEKQIFPVNSISAKGTTLQIKSIISNEDVTEEYPIREIAVFARENDGDEFLVSISLCTDNPPVVPVFENVPIEMAITDFIAISNAENCTIEYKSGVYVTQQEFQETVSEIEGEIIQAAYDAEEETLILKKGDE